MNSLKLIEIVDKADKDHALAMVPADTLEKFAELLILECLEQIYSKTIDNPTEDWDQGYDWGLNAAAETIKTHFGVRE